MSDFTRSIAPRTVAEIRRRLEGHDVPLPAEAKKALAVVRRVEKLKPEVSDDGALIAAHIEPDATADGIEQLASQIATERARRHAWEEALIRTNNEAHRALAAAVDDIIEAMRPKAEALIAEIEWYAHEAESGVSALLRAGRVEDARRASEVPQKLTEWRDLRDLRAKISGKRFTWALGGMWANAADVPRGDSLNVGAELEEVAQTVRDGGQLWWPTRAQAHEANEALSKFTRRQLQEERKAERPIGNFA